MKNTTDNLYVGMLVQWQDHGCEKDYSIIIENSETIFKVLFKSGLLTLNKSIINKWTNYKNGCVYEYWEQY
jgi:hypothetical protein